MKKNFLLLIIQLSLFSCTVLAQEDSQVYNKLKESNESVFYKKETGGYLVYPYFFYENGKNGICGYYDKNGECIIPPTKYTFIMWYEEYNAFVGKIDDEKEGIIDKKGKEIVPPIYEYVTWKDELHLFKCWKRDDSPDGKTDFYNVSGTIVLRDVSKCKGDWVSDIKYNKDEGLLCFQKDGLWGYFDVEACRIIIEPQYSSADNFEDGMAKVSKGKESFLISNPLKSDGKSNVLSSLSITEGRKSDIDENIPKTTKVEENTFAVIIANQNYLDYVVPFAINDGRTFKEYCLKTLGIPTTNVIYYEDASLNNLRSALSRIYDLAEVYEGDAKIIIYFSGQGASDNAGRTYLIPSDGTFSLIKDTGFPLDMLYNELSSLNVQATIMFIEADFNNETNRDKSTENKQAISLKSKTFPAQGNLTVLSATSEGETAISYKEMNHGLFTYYLCKYLQNSTGTVQIKDLASYVISNVETTSISLHEEKQTPILKTNNNKQQL